MYIYINIYIYIHTHTKLPVSDIVRLPHPGSGDSQGQETFLAPSADKQTRNYDTEGSKQPSVPMVYMLAKYISQKVRNVYILKEN